METKYIFLGAENRKRIYTRRMVHAYSWAAGNSRKESRASWRTARLIGMCWQKYTAFSCKETKESGN